MLSQSNNYNEDLISSLHRRGNSGKYSRNVRSNLGIKYNNRFFSSRKLKEKAMEEQCPFEILGVPNDVLYANVKKAFLKLAMEHHPDMVLKGLSSETATADHEKLKEKAQRRFIEIRQAFEKLRPLECGRAVLADGRDININVASDEAVDEFDDWFYSETGQHAPFGSFQIDRETIMEVAKMEGEVQHGLDRDGGMWQLAGMISNSVKQGEGKSGSGAENILRLEMGDVNEQSNTSKRRRRRRGSGF